MNGYHVKDNDPIAMDEASKETILNSVQKTHLLLILEEDYKSYGISSEIAAIEAEEVLYDIEAPVKRLEMPHLTIRAPDALHQCYPTNGMEDWSQRNNRI